MTKQECVKNSHRLNAPKMPHAWTNISYHILCEWCSQLVCKQYVLKSVMLKMTQTYSKENIFLAHPLISYTPGKCRNVICVSQRSGSAGEDCVEFPVPPEVKVSERTLLHRLLVIQSWGSRRSPHHFPHLLKGPGDHYTNCYWFE